ncbi:uncharacterized protein LOC124896585 [Capsicum annuum]|uniref:uncharacterized protein LOC124896585 n=1 Tax=Capsicum annuum TaxID=4072 RepID=UPI001FB10EB8|nr:uncharacterized protein LOC124896585 [Capsicum annuum]
MVNQINGSFVYYFSVFGACIREYAHMKKVISIDGTHLYEKYGGVLLSAVAQDTKNHIFPIAFCVVDKENDASWTFFFQKLKSIIEDEPYLLSSPTGTSALPMPSLVFTDAYTIDEFSKHLIELKNKIPKAAHVLENVLSFEKWSRAYFPGNRYDVMTTNITESLNSVLMDEREYPMSYILNSIIRKFGEKFRERHTFVAGQNNKFVSCAERILRDNKSVSDFLYVTNENGGLNQFMVFSNDVAVKVSLLERSCSCQKFNLVKMLSEHAMADLQAKYGDDIGYGNSIYEYSLPIYKAENYLLAY